MMVSGTEGEIVRSLWNVGKGLGLTLCVAHNV